MKFTQSNILKSASMQKITAVFLLVCFILLLGTLMVIPSKRFVSASDGPELETQIIKITESLVHNPRLYGHIYWQNGYPKNGARRPTSWFNTAASDNPDLIIQTGYYNWRFEADTLEISGYDHSDGTTYLDSMEEGPLVFTPADLLLRVYKDGVAYTATSGTIISGSLTIRLIENGQYVQRFDHTGVVFTDNAGNELDEDGYFEVTAWPDRIVYTLDFSESADITRTTIQVTSSDGEAHLSDRGTNRQSLTIQPQDHKMLAPLDHTAYITEAYETDTNDLVNVVFDEELHALRFDLDPSGISHANEMDRYDEYTFTVTNPLTEPTNIPLVFNQLKVPAVTGTVMQLVNDNDGRPTGIPVQISKNWHLNSVQVKHDATDGHWLRGSTMLTLDAGASTTLRLRVIYGYWDEVGTASHASLSIIGWLSTVSNWKWDESAIGAWGESATYDPNQVVAGAFFADIRPTWTKPLGSTKTSHHWTENNGGGDFLVYFDSNNDYRWGKQIKTTYRWTGPNVTEVIYSGISDDNKLRFTYTTQLVRSNDYHRRFYTYRYEILEDIVDPTRFVYMQMAADYYHIPQFDTFYTGNSSGLVSTVSPAEDPSTVNTYDEDKFIFNDAWLAIDDLTAGNYTARSTRGMIWQASTLNGAEQTVYIHPYHRKWGSSTTLFDLSAESVTQSYSAGDVIEGKVMFLLPPNGSDVYWGHDDDFSSRLATMTNPWDMVEAEFNHNQQMQITATTGTLVNHYPIVVDAAEASATVLAQVTVPANYGVGHIPFIIENAPANLPLVAQVYANNQWNYAINDLDNVNKHASYQGYNNGDGTAAYAFNIIRPEGTLDQEILIRVFAQTPSISLDKTNLPEYKIFQRDETDQHDFKLSGTYTSFCGAVQASFNDGPWVIIDDTPTGGTFSGTLADQPVGQGNLMVQCTLGGDADAVSNIGIGDVYVVAGQSNAEGYGTNEQLYTTIATTSAVFPTVYTEADEWKVGNDETDTDGGSGSAWPIVGGYIVEHTGVPVAFITTAEGEQSLIHDNADWAKGSSSEDCGNTNNGALSCYDNMIKQVVEADTGGIKAVLWYQGESDLGYGSAYKEAFEQLVADMQTDIGTDLVVIPQALGPILNSTSASLTNIRLAVMNTWDENPAVLYGPHGYDVHLTDDVENTDTIHFKEDDELQTQGYRWWKALEAHFYGGSANGGRGPIATHAYILTESDQIFITFSANSALDDSSGTTTAAWEVLDNGSVISVTSSVVTDNDTLILTLDTPPRSDNITVSYAQYNSAENENVIMDSSTGNLGLGPEGLPADPFLELPVERLPVPPTPTPTPTATPTITATVMPTATPTTTVTAMPPPSINLDQKVFLPLTVR